MNGTVRQFRDFFVSLKLTVVLLVLSLILIFFATLAQVDLGIWAVQEKYFQTFFVLAHVGDFLVPVFPGGYFIGSLLLLNLVSAHAYRLKLEWRKLGIQLTHSGLIVLLLGELITGLMQEDSQMQLNEGETKNYSESFRLNEIALVDTTDPKFDEVVVIPESLIAASKEVQHPKLPFRVVTKLYYPNSQAQPRAQVPNAPPAPATKGTLAERYVFTPQPITYRPDTRNVPVAVVELIAAEGPLGSWLVTTEIPVLRDVHGAQQLAMGTPLPQGFEYGGRKWAITLRVQRAYKPFALELEKVTHDVYVGTDLPKNFASRIKLTTPDGRDDRDVVIYMNNPLRYGGYTFYQFQMDSARGLTVFQVVRNPGWLLPYIACIMMGLGLVLQFGLSLLKFIGKRRAPSTPAAA